MHMGRSPAVKDCTGKLPTPICFQSKSNHTSKDFPTVMQEDCLVMNIYTPESRSTDGKFTSNLPCL